MTHIIGFIDHLAGVFGIAWPIVGGAFAAFLVLVAWLVIERAVTRCGDCVCSAICARRSAVSTLVIGAGLAVAMILGAMVQARASEPEIGAVVLCDTAAQAARVAELSADDNAIADAVAKVSAEANDPVACVFGPVFIFVRHTAAETTVRRPAGDLDVVSVMAIGIVTPIGALRAVPTPLFALLQVKGQAI